MAVPCLLVVRLARMVHIVFVFFSGKEIKDEFVFQRRRISD
jgi:hypothetical protein